MNDAREIVGFWVFRLRDLSVSAYISVKELPDWIDKMARNANNYEKMLNNFKQNIQKTGESDFYIRNIEISDELPFLPISAVNEYRRTLLKLLMKERLENYPREVQKPLRYVEFPKKELDYKANVHNFEADMFYQKCKSIVKERSFESSKPNRQVELMRTKHCIKYALGMCKSPQQLFLVDEKGKKYPLIFDCTHCEMAVLNY